MLNLVKSPLRSLAVAATILSASVMSISSAQAADKPTYKLAWTIYVGWMPWDYGAASGIVQKWADKYDINIEVVQVNDYIESINQYTAGGFDATVMTNMDALTIPAASGIDSTALIVGDFSNGNDGVVLKGNKSLKDLKGEKVNLVELSVSHYLLARALESVDLKERDIKVENTSDADLVAAFTTSDVTAVTTWNPLLSEITSMPDTNMVFDSSKIPGEIIDLLVVHTDTLNQDPKLGKALTGAWYEIMATMSGSDEAAIKARSFMAEASGTDLAGYDAQLASTKMFYEAKEAVDFTNSATLPSTMAKVAEFSHHHGLLGEGAPDASFIGIETPSGTYGDSANVKLRFTSEYMDMAVQGKL
ncbi:putative urea ABC transporter substrate-binding protein [Agarivorans sp. 1_MG-2023]|uniref:putative urea ABC transporter substrate-binding protein n=1 Tax=Agarivorans sp. 1_MG-2023 TaxID=3062634 RepID=UPI0026E276F5|nr:putative urea ABC transporter substrate-binding protein [Agarivorans sp. 1_MG-2023]MDO6765356.1 putative urea ABC transporter substrate-binding protein [Agarivorans sp. 1_MG-2023]